MYANTNADVIRSLDTETPSVTNPQHTLNSVRLGNGNVAILSYDWARIAEVTPHGDILVYEGHRGTSDTTDNHIDAVLQEFDESRLVRMSANPVDGTIPESIEFAGSYVGDFESMSPVDKKAQESVRTTMSRRLKHRS